MSTITDHGYRLIYVGKSHHLSDIRGYAYEHRIEAEKKLGRRLVPGEVVHHEDDNGINNEHHNLFPISRADHCKLHKPRLGTGNPVCQNGHIKDYTKPSGERICRVCRRAQERKRYRGNKVKSK